MMMRLAVLFAAAGAMEFRVATHTGNRFLDKKVDLKLEEGGTVRDLKRAVASKFPGNPPVALQRLFIGSALLADDDAELADALDEDAGAERVSLLLDTVPPAPSATSRPPDETEDRVRALAAETAALHATWRVLLERRAAGVAAADTAAERLEGEEEEADEEEEVAMRSSALAAEIAALEDSLFFALARSLDASQARVVSGVVRSGLEVPADFFAERSPPLLGAIDWRESLKLVVALLGAAKYGAEDAKRQIFFLACVPLVLILQLRPATFAIKLIWYALPRTPQNPNALFNVLFGASQQLMLSLDEAAYLDLLFRPLVPSTELAKRR